MSDRMNKWVVGIRNKDSLFGGARLGLVPVKYVTKTHCLEEQLGRARLGQNTRHLRKARAWSTKDGQKTSVSVQARQPPAEKPRRNTGEFIFSDLL